MTSLSPHLLTSLGVLIASVLPDVTFYFPAFLPVTGLMSSQLTSLLLTLLLSPCIAGWTPYALLLLWEICDKPSLDAWMPERLRGILYILAVGNSCINPFIHSHHLFLHFMKRHGLLPTSRGSRLPHQLESVNTVPSLAPLSLREGNRSVAGVADHATEVMETNV